MVMNFPPSKWDLIDLSFFAFSFRWHRPQEDRSQAQMLNNSIFFSLFVFFLCLFLCLFLCFLYLRLFLFFISFVSLFVSLFSLGISFVFLCFCSLFLFFISFVSFFVFVLSLASEKKVSEISQHSFTCFSL